MIPAYQQTALVDHCGFGLFNGLGLLPTEYTVPNKVFSDTYDADFDGEGYVGWCVCPHCRTAANHYQGFSSPEYECIECEHRSES